MAQLEVAIFARASEDRIPVNYSALLDHFRWLT
jgi:hypothetical protein